ncbi:hypothetical protein Pelo_16717 [Pelomyxa schiedti]|nr:hypothetical protein Pelo_16717 [Pelomyxa schiedti]
MSDEPAPPTNKKPRFNNTSTSTFKPAVTTTTPTTSTPKPTWLGALGLQTGQWACDQFGALLIGTHSARCGRYSQLARVFGGTDAVRHLWDWMLESKRVFVVDALVGSGNDRNGRRGVLRTVRIELLPLLLGVTSLCVVREAQRGIWLVRKQFGCEPEMGWALNDATFLNRDHGECFGVSSGVNRQWSVRWNALALFVTNLAEKGTRPAAIPLPRCYRSIQSINPSKVIPSQAVMLTSCQQQTDLVVIDIAKTWETKTLQVNEEDDDEPVSVIVMENKRGQNVFIVEIFHAGSGRFVFYVQSDGTAEILYHVPNWYKRPLVSQLSKSLFSVYYPSRAQPSDDWGSVLNILDCNDISAVGVRGIKRVKRYLAGGGLVFTVDESDRKSLTVIEASSGVAFASVSFLAPGNNLVDLDRTTSFFS